MHLLNRRTFMLAAGALSAWSGCSQAPPKPAFLSDLQLLSRDGLPIPDPWLIPFANPIDPTIQYRIDGSHPREHEGRKVVSPNEWMFVANLERRGEQLPIGGGFRDKKWYGEEYLGDRRGELIWESPELPSTIKPEIQWQWCHCRATEPGLYDLVVYLLPTAIRIGDNDMMIDHGAGIEIARRGLTIENSDPPKTELTMTITNGEMMPRSIQRKMRQSQLKK